MASDDSNDGIHAQIREHMAAKSTEELQQIYTDNDRTEYAPQAFVIIGQILDERGAARVIIPTVPEPTEEDSDGTPAVPIDPAAPFFSEASDGDRESRDSFSGPGRHPLPPAPPVPTHQEETPGFWEEFFSFRTMVSIGWVKINYVLGMVGIFIFSIWAIVRAVQDDSGGMFVIGFLTLVFGSLAWRLFCEAWIVFFSIHEALVSMDKKMKEG